MFTQGPKPSISGGHSPYLAAFAAAFAAAAGVPAPGKTGAEGEELPLWPLKDTSTLQLGETLPAMPPIPGIAPAPPGMPAPPTPGRTPAPPGRTPAPPAPAGTRHHVTPQSF